METLAQRPSSAGISRLRLGIAIERGSFFDPSAMLRAGFRAKNWHSAQNDEQMMIPRTKVIGS
jgi:hypothetical protein